MDTFKINDLKVASFLFAKGMKYLGTEIGIRGSKTVTFFLFEDSDKCRELQIAYINGAEAPARSMFDARETFLDETKKNY